MRETVFAGYKHICAVPLRTRHGCIICVTAAHPPRDRRVPGTGRTTDELFPAQIARALKRVVAGPSLRCEGTDGPVVKASGEHRILVNVKRTCRITDRTDRPDPIGARKEKSCG
jgi:hypothetical protein